MISSKKDSGLKWIGIIPESWEVTKIKYTTRLNGRIGWQGLTSNEYQDEGPYLITGTDFDNGSINFETAVHIEEKRWREAKQIQVENGDLLITKDGTVGKVAIISDLDRKASLNSGILRIRPVDSVLRKFLYYVLLSEEFWYWFNYTNSGASTIIHLYQNVFDNFMYALPPIDEQKKIIEHLDKKVGYLNRIRNTLEKQIDKLHEYRKSLIWETVTKGLNPSTNLENSGIGWIGKIPRHWSVKPVKYIFSEIGSGTTPNSSNFEYYYGDINWIQSGDLYKTDFVDKTSKKITVSGKESSSALKLYKAPFIALAMYGASIGNIVISRVDATVNQSVVVLKGNQNEVRYGKYAIEASKFELINQAQGGTQPNISQQLIKAWKIPYPPLSEQETISIYLDNKLQTVKNIIDNKLSQINVIDRQKNTLIYEYVTGKRRVE